MAERVRITDVSPRDGLQNEPGVIPTAEKVRLIELLCASGVDEVEIASFVSPKWVPQLADGAAVLSGVVDFVASPEYQSVGHFTVLVPNQQGFEAYEQAELAASGRYELEQFVPPLVDKLAVFTAASETFSRKNTNASIAEALERFRIILKQPRMVSKVRGYVSCAIACPFEGPVDPNRVIDVAAELRHIGVHEIDFGDTIGAGTPESVERLLRASEFRLGRDWTQNPERFTLHFHDTFGRAAECVKVALDMGVRSFDGSVAGLGGCPYASTPGKRAPGNISTERLVRTIHEAGYETGVDLDKLAVAAEFARSIVAKSRTQAAGGGA